MHVSEVCLLIAMNYILKENCILTNIYTVFKAILIKQTVRLMKEDLIIFINGNNRENEFRCRNN